MKSKLAINTLVALLLFVFPISMAGSAYSYAWCFGEDGSAKIEAATINGCADNGGRCSSAVIPDRQSFHHVEQNHSNPCSDLFIENSDAAVFKRSIKVASVSIENVPSSVWFPINTQSVFIPSTALSPSRISNTILEQRTVVLLN